MEMQGHLVPCGSGDYDLAGAATLGAKLSLLLAALPTTDSIEHGKWAGAAYTQSLGAVASGFTRLTAIRGLQTL